MLEVRPLCVCEITAILGLAASTVSKHLSILREAEMITDRKEGKWVNYYLNEAPVAGPVAEMLKLVSGWLPDDSVVAYDAESAQTVDRNRICGG